MVLLATAAVRHVQREGPEAWLLHSNGCILNLTKHREALMTNDNLLNSAGRNCSILTWRRNC